MVVAIFTAVAKVVTPTVVPTVVPTALMPQNRAIVAAATTLASHLRGPLASARADKRLFPIPFNRPFLSHTRSMRDIVVTAYRALLRRQREKSTHEPFSAVSSQPGVTNPGEPKTA
jgi:hypothetical protein